MRNQVNVSLFVMKYDPKTRVHSSSNKETLQTDYHTDYQMISSSTNYKYKCFI